MKLPFVQIDAFADRPFSGNPAAVMPLDRWLEDSMLQAIAVENNLSETAFLVRDESGAADYQLRWFTPAREVALCGHATLASGHFLLSRPGAGDRVTFATREAGRLEVARDDAGYAMDLPAYPPTPAEIPGLLDALGVSAGTVLHHPAGHGMVVLDDEKAVRALMPDYRALAAIGDTLNIVTAPGSDTDIVSRVFAPFAGINEDPVTGSAYCNLAPYWARRFGRPRFTAFQASSRGGHVDCEVDGDRVILRARCVTVIEGVFLI